MCSKEGFELKLHWSVFDFFLVILFFLHRQYPHEFMQKSAIFSKFVGENVFLFVGFVSL